MSFIQGLFMWLWTYINFTEIQIRSLTGMLAGKDFFGCLNFAERYLNTENFYNVTNYYKVMKTIQANKEVFAKDINP